ncbi:MAG: MarR family winged helix-turn-helix transcriptional regulator [Rhodoferax sp.]
MATKTSPPSEPTEDLTASLLAMEDRLTFLVHTVGARIASVGNRHFRAHDLNHFSARILVLLLQHEELRAGELVELMVLPQSTISSQLQALHAKRLIRRRRSRKDNRSVILTLTPEGLDLARDCDGLSLRVHHALLDDIGERERRAGIEFLRKVNQRLRAMEQQELYPFRAPARLPDPGAIEAPPPRTKGKKP